MGPGIPMELFQLFNAREARWLKEQSPSLPGFENVGKCVEIARSVKQALYEHFESGIIHLCKLAGNSYCPADRHLWLATIGVMKYGVIYFVNRYEARAALALYKARQAQFDAIASILRRNDNAI